MAARAPDCARPHAPVRRAIHSIALGAWCLALAGCASIDLSADTAAVTNDKFVSWDCPDILSQRKAHQAREKQLLDLIAKADSAPGGFIVSTGVYRSELLQAQGLVRAANRAAREKQCDLPPK